MNKRTSIDHHASNFERIFFIKIKKKTKEMKLIAQTFDILSLYSNFPNISFSEL